MSYFPRSTDIIRDIVLRTTGFVVLLIFILTMMSKDSHAIGNSMYYVRNDAHDGVHLWEENLAVYETESKLMCLMLCNHNEQCHSISFNSQSMKCQHFPIAFWGREGGTGTSESSWWHYDPFKALDCHDLHEKQYHYATEIYSICPKNVQCFFVKCEMEVEGGGWTLIQQRFDGTVDFQKSWEEYKTGFGDLNGEFWLGNDQIHAITTSADYELRIDMSDWHGNSWYAIYKIFVVEDENSQYMLTVGNYSGTAGDSFSYHSGMKFSTMDKDNDISLYNCAKDWGGNGGWWYRACDYANLNSLYGKDIGETTGIEWDSALNKEALLTMMNTRMMIRRL